MSVRDVVFPLLAALCYSTNPILIKLGLRISNEPLLGAAIGLGIGLVSEILKRGWFMVIRSQSRNAREGKEYPLVKAKTTIGRAEESDVGLFGDQSVANLHAVVERQKGKFILSRGEGLVRVNHVPVTQPVQLKNGDRVEIGGTLLLFRERAGGEGEGGGRRI